MMMMMMMMMMMFLLSQWPTFKLFGITYLVGKIKWELVFHVFLAE